MASLVTIDAAATKANTGTGTSTSLSFTFTSGTGTNKLLIACLSQFQDGTIGSVTWGANGLTHLITCDGIQGRVSFYYFLAPAASTSNTLTFPVTTARRMAAWAQSYADVDQATTFRTAYKADGVSVGPANIDITDSVDGDLCINALAKRDSTETPIESGPGEWTDKTTNATAGFNVWTGGQYKDGASGTVSFSWSWGGAASRSWGAVGTSIIPSGGVAGYSGRGFGRGIMRGVGR